MVVVDIILSHYNAINKKPGKCVHLPGFSGKARAGLPTITGKPISYDDGGDELMT